MTDNLAWARLVFLGVAVLGLLAGAAIWILRRRWLAPQALARWKDARPTPLSRDEVQKLQQWQRRMRWVAGGTLFYVGLMVGFTSALPAEAVGLRGVAFLVLPAMILGGVALQFSARCPRCGLPLGLQSSLGLPSECERCRVGLHAPKAEAGRRP